MRQLLGTDDLPVGARTLLNRQQIDAALLAMVQQIEALAWPRDAERQDDPTLWLCGIQRGGVAVARELLEIMQKHHGDRVQLGAIDVTLYRDDMWLKGPRAVEGVTSLPGDVSGQRVLLVDDVLFTGRTIRAALNVLMDFGRPEAVRLAVLVDRGGRELPVAAEVVGERMEIARGETVELCVDTDGHLSSVIVRPSAHGQ